MLGKFLTKFREIRIGWLISRLGKRKSYRAEDALVKIGPPAVELLIIALRSPKEEVAKAAAETLGRIKDARAVEPLIAALHDPRRLVRILAIEALGEIGDARAVDPLIEKLSDPDERIKEEAAQALGSIGDARAAQPLLKAAWDEHSRLDEINRKAIKALGQIGEPGVLPTLEKWHKQISDEWASVFKVDDQIIHPPAQVAEGVWVYYGPVVEALEQALADIRKKVADRNNRAVS